MRRWRWKVAPTQTPSAVSSEAALVATDLGGPQPLDVLVRHALEENRTVRAAQFNVLALKHRIPQVTALDDPIVSNTIFPIPSAAPQYSLMGYMPYATLLAQQFPWCGTLRLRGQAAEDDVKIALFELAAAQLDVVANVKRAYYDLHFNEHAEALLKKNRALAEDFLKVARERYRGATATQVDVLRAEVAISDINRELENTSQAVNEARAELARLLHVSPETPLKTLPDLSVGSVPQEVERLYQLVCASRPELQGRLAAIARDEKAIELARKGITPTSPWGWSIKTWKRPTPRLPGPPRDSPTSVCSSASICPSTTRNSPREFRKPKPELPPMASSSKQSETRPIVISRISSCKPGSSRTFSRSCSGTICQLPNKCSNSRPAITRPAMLAWIS